MHGLDIRVASSDFLGAINDVLHDQRFAISSVSFDRDNRRVVVPFHVEASQVPGLRPPRKLRSVQHSAELVIENVTSADISDSHGVDTNTFNVVRLMAPGRIEIVTNVPTDFVLSVSATSLTVHIAPSPVRERHD
jgi:hypothetical protein